MVNLNIHEYNHENSKNITWCFIQKSLTVGIYMHSLTCFIAAVQTKNYCHLQLVGTKKRKRKRRNVQVNPRSVREKLSSMFAVRSQGIDFYAFNEASQ